MSLHLPHVIGHRGAAAYAPENTLVGIRTAYDMGVDWVELDVKLTKDSIPILFHDDTIERTTNGGDSKIADLTYAEIKDLEAGSWFSEGYIGEPIPTLEEAVELLIELDMGLNLEIKPCASRERETTEAALDILSKYWDDHQRLLISSFQITCLESALDVAADWHRGLLLDKKYADNWGEIAKHLNVSTININGNSVTEEEIRSFQRFGKPLLAYTINDEDHASWLFDLGITGIFSDSPDLFLD